MVVIVLVFLLIIGMVFYYHANEYSYAKTLQHREDVDAILLAQQALALPEIRCGDYDGSCVDELKLRGLAALLNRSDTNYYDTRSDRYYSDVFGYATITFQPIGGDAIQLFDDPPIGNSSAATQIMFVNLFDPTTGSSQLSYLNVTRYRPEVQG